MKQHTLLLTLAASLTLFGCADADDLVADKAPEQTPVATAAEPPIAKNTPAPQVEPAKASPDKAKDAELPNNRKGGDADEAIDPDAELSVKRLVIARGVTEREPVGAANSFVAGDDRIYAFVEIANKDQATSEISVSFFEDGGVERSGVKLRVGAAPRWRTWSFTRLAKKPGTWHAVVRNANGEELARQSFEVVAAGTVAEPAKTEPAKTEPAKNDAPKADEAVKSDAPKGDQPAVTVEITVPKA